MRIRPVFGGASESPAEMKRVPSLSTSTPASQEPLLTSSKYKVLPQVTPWSCENVYALQMPSAQRGLCRPRGSCS